MAVLTVFSLVLSEAGPHRLAAGEEWTQLKFDSLRSGNAADRAVRPPLGLVAALPLTDAVLAAPVVTQGKVLVLDGAGVLFCADAATGRRLWKLETRGGSDNVGNSCSPAAIGPYIHFGTAAGFYYVVRIEDGVVVREIPCGEPIFSAPLLGNDRVYFATLGSRVHAVAPDGKVLWVWDYVKEHLRWDRDRWSGEEWATRKQRVTWKEQFCCSRDIALHGRTLVIPAGGGVVWLEDTPDGPRLLHVHAPVESPSSLGLSLDPTGAVYRQWYRRDNGGSIEILRLAGDKVEEGHVKGTESSWRGASSMGFSSVSLRGKDVYRLRPEEGAGFLCHQADGNRSDVLLGSASISSPVLVKDHAIFGGLDGALHVVPLSGQGEAWEFKTPFGKAITAPCAVSDGRVFFGGDDGYLYILGPDGEAEVPARDLELWKLRTPPRGRCADPADDWFTSFGNLSNTNANDQGLRPPFKLRWIRPFQGTVKHFSTFGGGRMYTHTAEGQVFAVEQATGRLLWRRFFPGVHVSYTSPLYWKERLYLPMAGLEFCRLRCMEAATGHVIWEVPFSGSPSWNRQQPPIVHDGVAVYLFSSGSYKPEGWLFEHQSTFGFRAGHKPLLRGWDAETGKELWTCDFSKYGAGGDDAGMCLLDGTIYYSCYFGKKEPPGVTAAIEPKSGRILWVNTKHSVHAGCAVSGKDGRLYLGGYNPVEGKVNRIWCLDARDGSLVWKSEPVSRAIHVITIREDTLFTHAQYAESYLLDRHTGKILATFKGGYNCTRFTVSEPYLIGANMDIYDLTRDFALVSTGPPTDVLVCVGALVSGGRLFFTTNGGGLQSCMVYGDEAKSFAAPWEATIPGEAPK
ncbi:MAG: PQQ-binding-like beta-propeller repeat protein [Planctomycetes bacterium]|nr:PQQ-binding-like beta-propeller repeat protein [Planctomycetota bacterium]